MGAACTHIDVSPEVAQTLFPMTGNQRNYANYIHDASFETIWKHIAPHIHNQEKRIIIRRLLSYYLRTKPCIDHYLSLNIDDNTWLFEIQTNRRISSTIPEITEIVLTSKRRQKN
jgi:hypothetical protein